MGQQNHTAKLIGFTKEVALIEYVQKQKSLADIAKDFGVSFQSVAYKLEKFGIDRRHGPKFKSKEERINEIRSEFPFVTKEFLIKEYQDNNKGYQDLFDEFKLRFNVTEFLLDYYCIHKRSFGEAANLKKTRDKYRETCIKNYGVENVSQNDGVKKKKCKTFLKHYGVDNVWKLKAYSEWLDIFMMDKYGKKRLTASPEFISEDRKRWWDSLTEQERGAQLSKMLLNGKPSSLEIKTMCALEKLGIGFVRQFRIKRKFYDILIPTFGLIIECNGNLYHANPKYYSEKDIIPIHRSKNPLTARELWDRDREKLLIAKNAGYSLIYLWEDDINQQSKSKTLEKYIITSIENEINKNKIN